MAFEEARVGERDAVRIFWGHSGVPHPRSRTVTPGDSGETKGPERRWGGTSAQPCAYSAPECLAHA